MMSANSTAAATTTANAHHHPKAVVAAAVQEEADSHQQDDSVTTTPKVAQTNKTNKDGCVKTARNTAPLATVVTTQNDAIENEKNLKSSVKDARGAAEAQVNDNGAGEEKCSGFATILTQESVLSAIDDDGDDYDDELPQSRPGKDLKINAKDTNIVVVKRAPLADDDECNVTSDSEEAV